MHLTVLMVPSAQSTPSAQFTMRSPRSPSMGIETDTTRMATDTPASLRMTTPQLRTPSAPSIRWANPT